MRTVNGSRSEEDLSSTKCIPADIACGGVGQYNIDIVLSADNLCEQFVS